MYMRHFRPSRRSVLLGSAGVLASSRVSALTRAKQTAIFSSNPFCLSLDAAPAYVGQVATRSFSNSTHYASTNGYNSRSAHYARTNISALSVGFANWWVPAGGAEQNGGNVGTYAASIEYPANVFTQLMFNGATTGTISTLQTLFTDLVAISIPKGALFWVRFYQTNTVGLFFQNTNVPVFNTSLGDSVDSGTSGNLTMGGTIVNSGVNQLVAPVAIVGPTNIPSIGIIGSSRFVGLQDTTPDATGDTGYCRMIGGTLPYMNMAIAGDTNASVSGSGGALRRALVAKYCSHLWLDPGLNDLNGGASAATDLGYIAAMANAWPSLSRVIINDEGPWTTSSDGWTTTVNQTAESWEAQRLALNSSIAALSGYNQIVKIAAYDTTSGSFWKNPAAGASQFTPDGIHENSATCIAIAAAGLFNPALVHR